MSAFFIHNIVGHWVLFDSACAAVKAGCFLVCSLLCCLLQVGVLPYARGHAVYCQWACCLLPVGVLPTASGCVAYHAACYQWMCCLLPVGVLRAASRCPLSLQEGLLCVSAYMCHGSSVAPYRLWCRQRHTAFSLCVFCFRRILHIATAAIHHVCMFAKAPHPAYCTPIEQYCSLR